MLANVALSGKRKIMSVILSLKVALVPLLIGGVTLAGRRWGPSVAGWLSAFPIVSAPILFFIALEQGTPFAAHASVATLSAVLAILVFGVSYAWAALRYSWIVSALFSFTCYFLTVVTLFAWAPSLMAAGVSVFLALAVAPTVYPNPPASAVAPASGARSDILWRMVAGAALVMLVTHFSSRLGARLSGLLAMFPVIASVLTVFSHIRNGTDFTIKQLRSMVLGYYAFASFCLVLALALPYMNIGLAFALSLAAAVVVQGTSRIYLNTQPAVQVDGPASGETAV
ncbi:hypothetical protein [Janthinobacterium sp. 17J80-10]|uniref:hypothetical protein n=1 Tax=Janthinobacterium sp. 17J80-10 TaxID=2497863 RepID=UPI0019D6E607|nr:hypothetical protein [Janthinobacterium sp. 17J80-10]